MSRFIVGYINQEFRLTFLWLSAGGAIAAVVTRASTAATATAASAHSCAPYISLHLPMSPYIATAHSCAPPPRPRDVSAD